VIVLDAMLWLTPRGEIAIPMRLISHAYRAMSIISPASRCSLRPSFEKPFYSRYSILFEKLAGQPAGLRLSIPSAANMNGWQKVGSRKEAANDRMWVKSLRRESIGLSNLPFNESGIRGMLTSRILGGREGPPHIH
jgi:hypothetical protein